MPNRAVKWKLQRRPKPKRLNLKGRENTMAKRVKKGKAIRPGKKLEKKQTLSRRTSPLD
jgi:hypothetical protein